MEKRDEETEKYQQNKYNQMRREVDSMKEQFQVKLQQFIECQKLMEKNTQLSNSEIEKLKQSHQTEVDNLVKEYNDKYKKMLVEKLNEIDTKTNEYEEKINKIKKEYENQINNLKKKYEDDISELASSTTSSNEQKIKQIVLLFNLE